VARLVSLLFLIPRTRPAVPWLQIKFAAAQSEKKDDSLRQARNRDAIHLVDSVLVMSNRAPTVQEIIEIVLPRQRDFTPGYLEEPDCISASWG
jgi:hypothetical protein